MAATAAEAPSSQTASLVRRLAGPSTGKAGYIHPSALTTALVLTHFRLATDQSEINRIIAEASKGSKFYEVRPVELLI
jgi:DNA polymerase kappa